MKGDKKKKKIGINYEGGEKQKSKRKHKSKR